MSTEHVVIGLEALTDEDRIAAARQVLQHIRPSAAMAQVDGFTDVRDLPPDVAAALQRIRELAPWRRRPFLPPDRTYMAVMLPTDAPALFSLVESFGPYSIHCELHDANGTEIATLHDTATSIGFTADEATSELIRATLQDRGWKSGCCILRSGGGRSGCGD